MSYYQIEICPLEEECRECKSGKNKMFWGHDEDQVKERVEWHLMKSQYHSESKADARLLADLSLIEFFEEPRRRRGESQPQRRGARRRSVKEPRRAAAVVPFALLFLLVIRQDSGPSWRMLRRELSWRTRAGMTTTLSTSSLVRQRRRTVASASQTKRQQRFCLDQIIIF